MKRCCVALFAVVWIAGCETPGRVVQQLPPPAVPHRPVIRPRVPVTEKPPARSQTTRSIDGATIVIDPGHGGRDPGAGEGTFSQLPEKTIVLDIASQVSQLLRERGASVRQTRSTDTFVELSERAAIAEHMHADLFVSIHADSAPNQSASGATILIYNNASRQSQKAGYRMVSALKRSGIKYWNFRRDNLHVLREHSRPAILVECGFLTNRDDVRMLNSPTGRARIAAAIADGITDYFAP